MTRGALTSRDSARWLGSRLQFDRYVTGHITSLGARIEVRAALRDAIRA